MVFGAFGEASEGVQTLVHELAASSEQAEGRGAAAGQGDSQGGTRGAGEPGEEVAGCGWSEGTGRMSP